ncbi:CZB domain-containing protein [Serratia fonticola]|uniref:CZB domain-containing protein n=1 Tax=Serratia fonticola TaxID=47917 RepID=UPI0015C59403|nr:CZB domain-containing protein [Serratia fonticola]MBC3378666.1 CZB domain-containing protein [Serratia fonticola]NYA37866.1 CZB domain-containing protein [Serratia fonticola]
MMLSPELLKVALAHIRASALSKSAYVQYTAQKCFRLRERMLMFSAGCREEAQSLTLVLNRQYSLVKYLSKSDGEVGCGKVHQLQTLSREQYEQTGHIQAQLSGVASGLALSADNLLFTLLKAQHYQWRDRLYIAILTGQSDELREDERECLLGRWIHGEGMRRFRALPGFWELGSAHHRLHEVSEVVAGDLSHFMPEELQKALQATEEASQRLLSALDALDERVGLLYPGGSERLSLGRQSLFHTVNNDLNGPE